ncbi:phosphoadenosine phosphosulfate reductase family protein [Streptomyces sp. NPDC058368]|uniref:phosphoadenosine phosphosulfate reductase domain-containing protein n=1 Tax=Streptomyces sp. NPDC058368 TaxID=3346461 RepID=UPI0036539BD6
MRTRTVDITTRLQLLDAFRCAHQADTALAAADRSFHRSTRATARALASAGACEQQLAAARDIPQALTASAALDDARQAHLDCTAGHRKAHDRLCRAFTASRRANRELAARYRPHARGRGTSGKRRSSVTAGLLDEVVAMPLELIRAADVLLVQSSGGKDSLVMLHRIATWADRAGCTDKVVVVHCDLGDNSEWPGVRELAQRQAERYGLRFVAVDSTGGLLGLVEKRGMFPDSARRLCTSSLKRDRANVLLTEVVAALGLDRQALVLNCMGLRAAESPARSRKSPLAIDTRASNNKRLVLTWHPILELSETAVWQTIADETLEYHPAYDALMPRLSCVFCVLAGFDVLVRAVRLCWALELPLPEQYTDLEARIGHRFKEQYSLADVVAEAHRAEVREGPLIWNRGDALCAQLGDDTAAAYLERMADCESEAYLKRVSLAV